jgi:hypothetical protein
LKLSARFDDGSECNFLDNRKGEPFAEKVPIEETFGSRIPASAVTYRAIIFFVM